MTAAKSLLHNVTNLFHKGFDFVLATLIHSRYSFLSSWFHQMSADVFPSLHVIRVSVLRCWATMFLSLTPPSDLGRNMLRRGQQSRGTLPPAQAELGAALSVPWGTWLSPFSSLPWGLQPCQSRAALFAPLGSVFCFLQTNREGQKRTVLRKQGVPTQGTEVNTGGLGTLHWSSRLTSKGKTWSLVQKYRTALWPASWSTHGKAQEKQKPPCASSFSRVGSVGCTLGSASIPCLQNKGPWLHTHTVHHLCTWSPHFGYLISVLLFFI